MTVEPYGVVKGRVLGSKAERREATPHFHILVDAADQPFRVAVNVRSRYRPHELLYVIADDYHHPLLPTLATLSPGFHPLRREPGELALDYLRGHLFPPRQLRPIPTDAPGENNDLNDRLALIVRQAMTTRDAWIAAFGMRWGPEPERPDPIFGFLPGNGLHNVHMNQGNPRLTSEFPSFFHENGAWQDGALFVSFPSEARWVAVFLAYQSQCWPTDSRGCPKRQARPLGTIREEPGATVRIVGLEAQPPDGRSTPGVITLLNASPATVDLSGWELVINHQARVPLAGSLPAGGTRAIRLPARRPCVPQGGIITLMNRDGDTVDGVSFPEADSHWPG